MIIRVVKLLLNNCCYYSFEMTLVTFNKACLAIGIFKVIAEQILDKKRKILSLLWDTFLNGTQFFKSQENMMHLCATEMSSTAGYL